MHKIKFKRDINDKKSATTSKHETSHIVKVSTLGVEGLLFIWFGLNVSLTHQI